MPIETRSDGSGDQKTTISSFKGTYSRGTGDEVPPDHAVDSQDVIFPSANTVKTRPGIDKVIQTAGAAIRRFFLLEATPPNYLQPVTGDPSATDGSGMIFLDNANNLRIGNDSTPVYTNGGMNDFFALNVGNRTFISGFDRFQSQRSCKLQTLNSFNGTIRNAAGLAPRQASGLLAAANSATVGSVPAGVHGIAVVYQTDTGFWTQPGPKKTLSCTPTASTSDTAPTKFACAGHGMVTGESHTIYGGTGNWANCNDTWYITRIDDNTFSIPLDSFSLGAVTGTFTVDAAFTQASVTATGGFKVSITNIPTGPAGTVARLILATRANETEFFFVPNTPGCVSVVNDNSSTTTTIDFSDTDLTASADYLFDIMEVIPAGTSLTKYRGRVVVVGASFPGTGTAERIFLSNIGDPETFNYVSGYVQVQTESDGNNPAACYVLRDTLYVCKFTGTFGTQDNGNEPSTWPVTNVDLIIGAYAYGISVFTVSQSGSDTGDIVLLASKIGLILFDGVMRRPELSWKIEAIWNRIPINYFHRVTVAHDPWNHRIYVSCPLDSATEPDHLLVCDYTDGRDYNNVKWTIYHFPINPTCVGMAEFGSLTVDTQYTLKIGTLSSAYLYHLDPLATNDDGSKIASYYKTFYAFIGTHVVTWKMLNFRVTGTGHLNITLSSEDETVTVTPPFITLGSGREWQRGINFVNEKMSVKIALGTTLNDTFTLNRIDIWGGATWQVRPAL